MVHVKTPNQPDVPDVAALRCGVQRQSMRTNVLIHRPGLAEVSKMTFVNPAPDRVFGVPKRSDPEGARDVTTFWKCHQANPNDSEGTRPPPLFLLPGTHCRKRRNSGLACAVANLNV